MNYHGKSSPRPGPRNPWGEKRQRTMSLSAEAWHLLGELAENPSINNRSEAMEIAVRWFAFKADDPAQAQQLLRSKSLNS